MRNGWHYVVNGGGFGPVERSEVERLVSNGTVKSQTLVWRDGMDGWEEAGRHFEVIGGVGGPPAIPPRVPISGGVTSPASAVIGETSGRSRNGLYSGAPAREFGEAISVCFNKFVTFSGRASRSELWYFQLFTALVAIVTVVVDMAFFGMGTDPSLISSLPSIVFFLPLHAVYVRRLHDTDRSGWWLGGFYILLVVGFVGIILIGVAYGSIPHSDDMILGLLVLFYTAVGLIYSIVLLVFLCRRGNLGPNRFC